MGTAEQPFLSNSWRIKHWHTPNGAAPPGLCSEYFPVGTNIEITAQEGTSDRKFFWQPGASEFGYELALLLKHVTSANSTELRVDSSPVVNGPSIRVTITASASDPSAGASKAMSVYMELNKDDFGGGDTGTFTAEAPPGEEGNGVE